jgi:ribosomal protein L13
MAYNIAQAAPVFRVFEKPDLSYGVEITIVGAEPVSVTGFATETAAADWITGYQRQKAAANAGGKRSWARR